MTIIDLFRLLPVNQTTRVREGARFIFLLNVVH